MKDKYFDQKYKKITQLKTYNKALNTKDFTISSEIFLRPDTDEKAINFQADILRESVDAILVTDNQSGQLHMSSLAAGVLLKLTLFRKASKLAVM